MNVLIKTPHTLRCALRLQSAFPTRSASPLLILSSSQEGDRVCFPASNVDKEIRGEFKCLAQASYIPKKQRETGKVLENKRDSVFISPLVW